MTHPDDKCGGCGGQRDVREVWRHGFCSLRCFDCRRAEDAARAQLILEEQARRGSWALGQIGLVVMTGELAKRLASWTCFDIDHPECDLADDEVLRLCLAQVRR